MDAFVLALVLLALSLVLGYTFTNGFNDASSVVATAIASGALRPAPAVVLAASVGALGVALGGGAVAHTITTMVAVPPDTFGLAMVMAALTGAIAWNVITWRLGLPSSSSHALIGGLVGAACVAQGPGAVDWGVAWLADPLHRPLQGFAGAGVGLVLSPALGFGAAMVIHRAARIALRNAHVSVNDKLKRAQLFTSFALAFGNGSNDGQKAIGMFAFVLIAAGLAAPGEVPLWVTAAVIATITAGTLGGGWTIMATLGRRIFPLEPIHALDSQIASGAVLLGATAAGAPVSSTHVVASSVMGVGAAEHYRAVRWGVAKHILQAWVTTIPASAAMAALVMGAVRLASGS